MKASPLAKALEARGLNLSQLAKRVAVDKATTTRWAQKKVPPLRVLAVEGATGIPRHELRPDLYPPPDEVAQ